MRASFLPEIYLSIYLQKSIYLSIGSIHWSNISAARVESRRTSMRLLALAVGLLAPLAEAKTRHCADAVVNEALVSFDDYACVTDMKSCIGAGTCLAAGIKERRLCECYLQV